MRTSSSRLASPCGSTVPIHQDELAERRSHQPPTCSTCSAGRALATLSCRPRTVSGLRGTDDTSTHHPPIFERCTAVQQHELVLGVQPRLSLGAIDNNIKSSHSGILSAMAAMSR